ncbi:uncharacterized protein LOC134669460 [Cydia fagiglandana]|uniref:uncharacterized protein LOC134669460 n=1 Tax=Cydia fagiglandana TaxID=1458189 RepID=UPI002FEDE5E7
MAKCCECGKIVSKKDSGLQCSTCNKWWHGRCVSITNEQLAALVSTDAAWKCRKCTGTTKNKRISIILPDPVEDDNNSEVMTPEPERHNKDQLVKEIRQQIKEIWKDELTRQIGLVLEKELKSQLQFYSDKIDDYQESLDSFKEKAKRVENENIDLKNKLINMKNKVELLEQKVHTMEQVQMGNHLEICGIQKTEGENLKDIVKKIAEKINQDPDDVIQTYRKASKAPDGQKRNLATVVVTLREGRRDKWLDESKTTTLTGRDLGRPEDYRIFMREALSPTTAYLLWKAKSELKETNMYKFVWCKKGCILIKKDEQGKTHPIRSVSDIEYWASKTE